MVFDIKKKANEVKLPKPLRFLIAGGSAAAVEYLAFLAMMLVPAFATLVALNQVVSYLFGFVVSFWLQRKWVYKSSGSIKNELGKYFVLALINLLLTAGVIILLVDYVAVDPLIAKIIVMVMVAVWNYVIFGKVIFRTTHKGK